MGSRYDDALARGRRAGIVLAAALLYGCGAGARPLRLPEGHPADPAARHSQPSAPPTAPPPAAAEPAAPAKVYDCPMHPEVVSNEPGRCPKCGMRLREAKAAGEEGAK